jgi:hypothetical protein
MNRTLALALAVALAVAASATAQYPPQKPKGKYKLRFLTTGTVTVKDKKLTAISAVTERGSDERKACGKKIKLMKVHRITTLRTNTEFDPDAPKRRWIVGKAVSAGSYDELEFVKTKFRLKGETVRGKIEAIWGKTDSQKTGSAQIRAGKCELQLDFFK